MFLCKHLVMVRKLMADISADCILLCIAIAYIGVKMKVSGITLFLGLTYS